MSDAAGADDGLSQGSDPQAAGSHPRRTGQAGSRRSVWARRALRTFGVISMLMAIAALRVLTDSEGVRAQKALILTAFLLGVGVLLVTRPLARYPLRAVVGGFVLLTGAFWFTEAWISNSSSTWLILYDMFPDAVFEVLLDLNAHKPPGGLVLLGAGLALTISGTWTPVNRRELVLYDPDEDDWFTGPADGDAAGADTVEESSSSGTSDAADRGATPE